jgi:hypothetical protein
LLAAVTFCSIVAVDMSSQPQIRSKVKPPSFAIACGEEGPVMELNAGWA